jgi:hypothetical protein
LRAPRGAAQGCQSERSARGADFEDEAKCWHCVSAVHRHLVGRPGGRGGGNLEAVDEVRRTALESCDEAPRVGDVAHAGAAVSVGHHVEHSARSQDNTLALEHLAWVCRAAAHAYVEACGAGVDGRDVPNWSLKEELATEEGTLVHTIFPCELEMNTIQHEAARRVAESGKTLRWSAHAPLHRAIKALGVSRKGAQRLVLFWAEMGPPAA